MTPKRQALVALVKAKGLQRREEPFQLASGEWSHDYVDGRAALAYGDDLRLASEVVLEMAAARGAEFDAVGGLTMGSDPLAHGVAITGSKAWFSVRKEAKGHGKRRQIEGVVLAPGTRVLLVEDVATTGGSILRALEAVEAAGAPVVLAVTLIDRGRRTAAEFARRGIPYEPVATFEDLGIDPIGGDPVSAASG